MNPYKADVETLARCTRFVNEWVAAGGPGVYVIDRAEFDWLCAVMADGVAPISVHAVFDKALRSQVVFSDHSLVTDAVFAEMHLISCRNVLIYFDRELQDRAIGLFRDSLARKGFLGLGSKESLRFSEHAAAFSNFVTSEKIYQRLDR